MDRKSIFELIDKCLDGNASPAEQRLLEEYYSRLQEEGGAAMEPDQELLLKEKIYQAIEAGIKKPGLKSVAGWKKLAVAASLFLAIGLGFYLINFKSRQQHKEEMLSQSASRVEDLPPGRDAAILTLADGKIVNLEKAPGNIVNSNGMQIINTNGLLQYQGKTSDHRLVYNTLSTARGNQYQLQLEDGTKVWLNSASTLRFPVAFKGAERKVELSGEAYFEVAHNPAKPFKVVMDKQVIEVLGTHFNVNGYKDEAVVRTTLLEGSLRTSIANGESSLIKPGEQSVLRDAHLTINRSPDVEKVMAWKNGWFEFDQMDLDAIMRQVSRWYDVDIEYEGNLPNEKYGGRIRKSLPLSAVIDMMKMNGVEC
ncbi:MAG TPA: FecR domain-containing protein, partial [Chitinophagaceae bacterium]|nr:FecR domain-containing protein [Chitinophagaceae bacterium]